MKRTEMLAALSDLVAECGETKTTKKNKEKENALEVGSDPSSSV